MPAGSSAALIAWCTAIESSPSSAASQRRLMMPTPCSPVSVPPRSIAAAEHLVGSGPDVRGHVFLPAVEDEDRVQVAVPGVGHGGDQDAVPVGGPLDALDHVRQPGPGHAHVLDQRRAEPLGGQEGQAADVEQLPRLRLAARHVGRAARRARWHICCMISARRAASSLSSWAMSSAWTSSPKPRCFQSSIARSVTRSSSSSRLGCSRACRIAVTARAAAPKLGKLAARVTGGMAGRGPQPQGGRGDHPEGALRTDEQAGEVVAGHALDRPAAGAQHPAVGQHDLQPEHGVPGDAVLHAAQPARVGGQVPADRGYLEARRVGRVHQPVGGGGAVQVGVEHAGLGHGQLVGRVELHGSRSSGPARGSRSRRPRPRRPPGRSRRRAAPPGRVLAAQRTVAATSPVLRADTRHRALPGVHRRRA